MKNANTLFYIALICGIWFALTSAAWTYFMNLFISFPFGITAFLLARSGKKIEGNTKRFKAINIILILGSIASLVVLVGYLIYN